MKPSEYYNKKLDNFKKKVKQEDIDSLVAVLDFDDLKEKTIKELDKRFIDREELKDKINKLFKNKKRIHDSIKCGNYIEYYDIGKQEILELLK